MSIMETPVRTPSYRKQWAVSIVGMIAFGVGLNWYFNHTPDPELPAPPGTDAVAYTDWFMLVRCPEMPIEAREAEAGVQLLADWVQRLRAEGFNLRPFAEVMAARQQGDRLPERTVVLVFDPAYRVTVEQVLPRLRDLTAPALFITRLPGTIQSDRRFVSNRTRRVLSETELWDFALQTSQQDFLLEVPGWPESVSPGQAWSGTSGLTGVNEAFPEGPLNILHANVHWSSVEFVDRLKADVPLRRESRLSLRTIGDRNWGILADEDDVAEFDLTAADDARFASVSWAGARGVGDMELEVSLGSWFGEAWLFLRSNTERAERIRVGFTESGVRVLQEQAGAVLSDHLEPALIQPADGIQILARIEKGRLHLKIPQTQFELEIPVVIPATSEGIFEFALYDRIHGAAVARDVLITVNPLDIIRPRRGSVANSGTDAPSKSVANTSAAVTPQFARP